MEIFKVGLRPLMTSVVSKSLSRVMYTEIVYYIGTKITAAALARSALTDIIISVCNAICDCPSTASHQRVIFVEPLARVLIPLT
jgi:hypothetical protein